MVAATMPTAFSGPAGTMVEETEVDTRLIRNSGFQPISSAFLMACAPNFGVPANRNASAPYDFSKTTWESIGSLTSGGLFGLAMRWDTLESERCSLARTGAVIGATSTT